MTPNFWKKLNLRVSQLVDAMRGSKVEWDTDLKELVKNQISKLVALSSILLPEYRQPGRDILNEIINEVFSEDSEQPLWRLSDTIYFQWSIWYQPNYQSIGR